MRYCWSHSDNSGNLIAPGVILLGVLCISSAVRESTAYAAKLLIIFGCLYAPLLWGAFVSSRKYEVNTDGLTVIYPFGIKVLYPWNSFTEIALCKVHYASRSTKHILAIRCAMDNECCVPKGVVTSRAWWTAMPYEFLHFRKLVTVYYTEERYAEFVENCPYQLKDYSNLKDCM